MIDSAILPIFLINLLSKNLCSQLKNNLKCEKLNNRYMSHTKKSGHAREKIVISFIYEGAKLQKKTRTNLPNRAPGSLAYSVIAISEKMTAFSTISFGQFLAHLGRLLHYQRSLLTRNQSLKKKALTVIHVRSLSQTFLSRGSRLKVESNRRKYNDMKMMKYTIKTNQQNN